ncbi:hypothetical protein BC008_31495 [Mastigocoleus testarum BC008]|uniref:Peptidase S8/S53 domain-containing protein n=1 Tax=Mastigocoleus testarum BC008 TaxID=371196 RepID=A0A0V7ZUP2_9CYAN|nr:hypothetical protein BC008_31495 [Mastigocoleus testarum BC008]
MKSFLSGILLLTCFLPIFKTQPLKAQTSVVTNSQTNKKLFYTYYNKKIPLILQEDIVAISFKPKAQSRASLPLHLKLQLDLNRSVGKTNFNQANLSLENSSLRIKPFGKRYALMRIPSTNPRDSSTIQRLLKKQAYVENTLPVFSRQKSSPQISGGYREKIILPNEIILHFDEQTSNSQKQKILRRHNLSIIRPLRFSSNRYLVKSLSASGVQVLDVANRLYRLDGIKSATPNFNLSHNLKTSTNVKPIDLSIPFFSKTSFDNSLLSPFTRKFGGISNITQRIRLGTIRDQRKIKNPFQTSLLPLQWHLNSAPFSYCLNQFPSFINRCLSDNLFNRSRSLKPSTDIGVIPAWSKSKAGKGVVVAVLDDFIQWNHPDLIGSLYRVGNVQDKLRGEKHGWDFVGNDPDTRINPRELSTFRPIFQDSFLLSDDELLEKYADDPFLAEISSVRKELIRHLTKAQIAQALRDHIRKEVSSLFHGTWVSGVIAARPQGKNGVVGVAPKAKFLPVKVSKTVYSPTSGFETMYQVSQIIEGIGYAIARGADIINMSYGSYLPTADETDTIVRAQKENPDLVFVAAVGNEGIGRIGFPAAIEDVIGVGGVNFKGNRASYSNFGNELTVVAPGGDVSTRSVGVNGGILTTGGQWVNGLWQGIDKPRYSWNTLPLSRGKYIWVEGTSFASPMVAGVVALMKGEDPQRVLSRKEILEILKRTSSYRGLKLSNAEKKLHQLLMKRGRVPRSVSAEKYFFGSGLINADAAVREVQNRLVGRTQRTRRY